MWSCTHLEDCSGLELLEESNMDLTTILYIIYACRLRSLVKNGKWKSGGDKGEGGMGGACVSDKGSASFIFRKDGLGDDGRAPWVCVTDGAWCENTRKGVAAWVRLGGRQRERVSQVVEAKASSATLVEVKAGILVLLRAVSNNVKELGIQTDSEGLRSLHLCALICKQPLKTFVCYVMYRLIM
ncbi:hypothetical protein RHMOL_Rhmol06G0155300 [Rhododendron molle]|uniref:Uncharacterized protein n=1 Tax=Rhododendron molle TaxID=49168 RepID=A0ACC0NDG1_RHOML|nr:hypothetical protein RHMOL_Rhmol06G0155300 [Rhododendron molle]